MKEERKEDTERTGGSFQLQRGRCIIPFCLAIQRHNKQVHMPVNITPMITVTVMITFTFSSLSVNQRKHLTHSSK
jgi:hypothetical protein